MVGGKKGLFKTAYFQSTEITREGERVEEKGWRVVSGKLL